MYLIVLTPSRLLPASSHRARAATSILARLLCGLRHYHVLVNLSGSPFRGRYIWLQHKVIEDMAIYHRPSPPADRVKQTGHFRLSRYSMRESVMPDHGGGARCAFSYQLQEHCNLPVHARRASLMEVQISYEAVCHDYARLLRPLTPKSP
nr:hypothetical protein CFP56_24642 [Quercus suber]